MAQLGKPYRILYIARRAVQGLLNINAWVLKPDMTVVGFFPLTEAPFPFVGCYYYDYISSSDDPEGEYFSRVTSPSEARFDIVRFGLYADDSVEGLEQRYPSQLVGFVVPDEALAAMKLPDGEGTGFVSDDKIQGSLAAERVATGILSDQEVEALSKGRDLKLNLERD